MVPVLLDQLQVLLHAHIAIGLESFGPLIIGIYWGQIRLKNEALLSCELGTCSILASCVNGWHLQDFDR